MRRVTIPPAGRMPIAALLIAATALSARAQIQQTPATTLEAPSRAATLSPGVPLPSPPPSLLGPVPAQPPPAFPQAETYSPLTDKPFAPPQPPSDPDMPKDTRSGMFQKLVFDADWLAPDKSRGLGMADFGVKCMLALPLPNRDWPLLITPGFGYHLIDAPSGAGLPEQVYGANIEFRWLPKLTDQLRLDLEVLPGVYGDFKDSNNKGTRTTFYGAAIWTFNGRDKIVLGASYRDRHDVPVIPLVGLLWRPYPELKADLLFPEPKIAHRVYWFGHYGDAEEDWVYVSGEFADDVYAFERGGSIPDSFSYRDVRLILGLEHKAIGRLDWRAEVGYVFARKVRSLSALSDYDPTSTVMLRGGLVY